MPQSLEQWECMNDFCPLYGKKKKKKKLVDVKESFSGLNAD